MKPNLTFVVPAYESAAWINKTFNSLHNQSYPNIEVIVLDDGSTDSVDDIAEYWCQKDNRFKYIKGDGKRRGAAYRRNQGNRLAEADLICVADAGDEYHSLKAAVVLDYFDKNPKTDLLYHSCKVVDAQGKDKQINMAFKPILRKAPRGISHPTVTYKKDMILKHPYREDCIDTDQYEAMLLTFWDEGYRFEYIRNILLKKWDMTRLKTYRDLKSAYRKKLDIYKEFGVEIEQRIYDKAGVKPGELNAGLSLRRRSDKVSCR